MIGLKLDFRGRDRHDCEFELEGKETQFRENQEGITTKSACRSL